MPFKHGREVEGNYYLVAERAGDKDIANCLLSQITNTDPVDLKTIGPGPKPQFVVGDISVFMLTDMYDVPYTTFINADDWNHMGIHEYYKVAQQTGERQRIHDKIAPIVSAKFE